MPFVKPAALFPRIAGSALKTFTHGYAQTVVAASQSSYAAQNTPTGPLADTLIGRLRSSEKQKVNLPHLGDSARHAGPLASERPGTSHPDSEIKQYYDAWQKHQRGDKYEPWQQFQFARRIEWQPPSTVPEGNALGTKAAAEVEDVEDVKTTRDSAPRMKRSYTTTALDNFRDVFFDPTAEAVARAQVDEAIAEEIQRSKDDASVARSSPSASTGPSSSFQHSSSSPATSIARSEADFYTDEVVQLANTEQYEQVPAAFQAMLRAGVMQPPQAAYRALLQAAIRLTQGKHLKVPKALEVYSDMLRRQVSPDVETYGLLIGLLSKRASEVATMRRGLEERRARYGGLEEPDSFLFRSSQSEHAMLAGDSSLPMAMKMFEKASAMPQNLPGSAYAALISACAEHNQLGDMERVFSHAEHRSVETPSSVYPQMIEGSGRKGDLKRSVELYDQYKNLAIAHNEGLNNIVRADNEVYASLIKAYGAADRLKQGLKFLSSIQAAFASQTDVDNLRDVVARTALLPLALKDGDLEKALDIANSMTASALNNAMAAICIAAADRNALDVSNKAFEILAQQSQDLSKSATAMLAMHVRNANVDAAEPFWHILEHAPAKAMFIEPTVMRAIALIGIGQSERGLRHSRRMFTRIRDSQPESRQSEIVDQIDEATEVISIYLFKGFAEASPQSVMEVLRMMTENAGLITPIAEHAVARLGPEQIALLSDSDVELLLRVQSAMVIDETASDLAGPARFTCLLETIVTRHLMPSSETENAIERTLINIDRPEASQLWNNYRYPQHARLAPTPFTPALAVPQPTFPAFDDAFDPYASRTDVKGSNIINELLERPQGRRMNDALTRFRNMRRIGRVPRMFTYGKLIEAACREHNFALARDVLEMAKQDVPFDARYRVVRFGWQQILDQMIAGSLSLGRRDLAATYHQELNDMGGAPSANTFGLYITTLKANTKTFDEASEAVKIFLRSKSEGVEPSSFLYNALIGKLGKARRIDDCLFYFAEMRNLSVRPTSVTYGTIVNALCRVSDDKFAEEIFEEMESSANYKPRPAPYHSLMQFFLTSKRDRSKVLSYYERMRAKGIAPTMHTYKLLIDTYATLEPVNMPAAENVLAEMRAAGFRPEAVHYASLIHAKGCVLHDMEGARQTFDTVLADSLVEPLPCLYQALFEAMNANHSIVASEPLLADMAARGVEFTPYIANALIHGWTLEKDISKAESVFNKIAKSKREPSTYEAMVRAYLAAEDRTSAKSVVREALSHGYPSAVAGKIADLKDLIDKKNMEIKPEDGQVYSNVQELADELPDNSPRYILLSYPITMVSR
ncbi:hypothetical protein K431DRAFT_304265 [Polychaeton citri CBS 116435]|uniref:Tetratricopeptide repeat domain-containing protein n=1 Tax=Polychaeton citri CBS 116435 TaxID=1314669 RepID=A0A9P4Q9E2_9PEZI|nr:hypothetical protein K431DRAFT_304265 [Polychaeton citri CBS 116435]